MLAVACSNVFMLVLVCLCVIEVYSTGCRFCTLVKFAWCWMIGFVTKATTQFLGKYLHEWVVVWI